MSLTRSRARFPQRARPARALLEDLTRPKAERRPEDLSRLAHLALSHKLVRDSLLADTGRNRAKTHLLVDLYRGAPEGLPARTRHTGRRQPLRQRRQWVWQSPGTVETWRPRPEPDLDR